MIWSFIADFSPLIAFRPLDLQQLMEAVQAGSLSQTLVNLHTALIRFIQSEAEIANAIGSVHVCPLTPPRAVQLIAEQRDCSLAPYKDPMHAAFCYQDA